MEHKTEDELRREILRFLRDFKELMDQGRYLIKTRTVNTETLVQLGITKRQRDEIIYSLSVLDFCSGPIRDLNDRGNLWVFGQIVSSKEIYIKLQIVTRENAEETAFCVSFHQAELPLKYPFREASKKERDQ